MLRHPQTRYSTTTTAVIVNSFERSLSRIERSSRREQMCVVHRAFTVSAEEIEIVR